jgi:hypothetical protein
LKAAGALTEAWLDVALETLVEPWHPTRSEKSAGAALKDERWVAAALC